MSKYRDRLPTDASSVQQSRNMFTETLTIKKTVKRYGKGAKYIVDGLPDVDNESATLTELTSEDDESEYPHERDHYTVTKHEKRDTDSDARSPITFKQFNIRTDEDYYSKEVDNITQLIELLGEHAVLDEQLDALSSYSELMEAAVAVRQYDAICETINTIWANDNLSLWTVSYTGIDFEINQDRQGFYFIPHPHHPNVREILNEEIAEQGLGVLSTAWGGFMIDDEAFNEIHDVLSPFYRTPESYPGINRSLELQYPE